MLKIGIDKTDKNYRHFEYDDERRYGNPQVYKVLYEESGVFGEVLCSNVITIKKSNNIHNHFLDIPIYGESKIEEVIKPNKTVDIKESVADKQPVVIEEKKKTKSSKTKSNKKVENPNENVEEVKIKGAPFDINQMTFSPKTYGYDVFVIDDISNVDDIKNKLNEFGKGGWEVCGFQIVQKILGCQAIFIMKKGLI